MMAVPQLVFPNTNWPLVREVGATACTSDISICMACASSSVRRWRVCAPSRTPACDTPPGSTSMMLEPSPFICSCTRCVAPLPTATMVMTAPTPMMMPSMVSSERSLLASKARKALRTAERKFTASPPCRTRRGEKAADARLRRSARRGTPSGAAPRRQYHFRG